MSAPAATLARMASVPEWLRVPSPRFWMTCGSATKGDRPIHGTPSAPIGGGGRLFMPWWRASKYMIPWQPTPPPTSAPSGVTVDRLCGHPLQNPGERAGGGWGGRPPRPAPRELEQRQPGLLSAGGEGGPPGQDPGEDLGHRSRVQLAGKRREGLPGPVALAEHGDAASGLVQDGAQLRFDERPLLLDDDDLADGGGELADRVLGQRVGHAELQDPDSGAGEVGETEPEVGEGLDHVEVRLAGADHTQPRPGPGARHAIEPIVPRVGPGGAEPTVQHQRLLVGHGVGADRRERLMAPRPAVDHDVAWVTRAVTAGIEVDGADAVGDGGDDLQPDPRPRVPRQPEGMNPQVEHVLLVCREQH